jgi:AraC-like DNA-binding protein
METRFGRVFITALLLPCVLLPLFVRGQEQDKIKSRIIVPVEDEEHQKDKQAKKKTGPPKTALQLIRNFKNKTYTGEIVDLNFKRVDMKHLLSWFSKLSGIEFRVDPAINEQTTCVAHQVPWDRVLHFFLKDNQLAVSSEGGALRVKKAAPTDDSSQSSGSSTLFIIIAALLILPSAGMVFYLLALKKRGKREGGKKNSKKPSLPAEKAEEYIKRIIYLFEVERIYRQEDISLNTLSGQMGVPAYQLSLLINDKLNKTFSELVNHHRVEEVKQRLSNPAEKNKKIIDIAFEAGFNTKTSFNRTFKKYTGMTPSQYQEKYSS